MTKFFLEGVNLNDTFAVLKAWNDVLFEQYKNPETDGQTKVFIINMIQQIQKQMWEIAIDNAKKNGLL